MTWTNRFYDAAQYMLQDTTIKESEEQQLNKWCEANNFELQNGKWSLRYGDELNGITIEVDMQEDRVLVRILIHIGFGYINCIDRSFGADEYYVDQMPITKEIISYLESIPEYLLTKPGLKR